MIGLVTSSGEKSATAQVYHRTSYLHSFEINPPTFGLATLKIYDGTDSTGLLLASTTVAAGMNAIHAVYVIPKIANSGIHCVLTGTTTYNVGFSPA